MPVNQVQVSNQSLKYTYLLIYVCRPYVQSSELRELRPREEEEQKEEEEKEEEEEKKEDDEEKEEEEEEEEEAEEDRS